MIAINIAWVAGLCGFGAGLFTQNAGNALQGLALYFAAFFYTLVRAYQLRRMDSGDIAEHPEVKIEQQAVRTYRRAVNLFLWVGFLPTTMSGTED